MEEAFRTALTSFGAVTALVPAARINWGAHPQGVALPGVVLSVASNSEGLTQQGPDGLFDGRVQADCYAMSYAEAKAASRAIILRLHGYRGNGFGLVRHVATRDSREGGANEAERPYRVSLDFLTSWRST
jgi:hypothetical protein